VRESTRLALVGMLLTLAATRSGPGLALALAFAAPHLLHAALGTRRGPAFVTTFLLCAGYYAFRGRRPPVGATLAGGATLGLLILFLLANRPRMYLGSDIPITFDLTDSGAFHPGANNDYIVAAGLVTTARRMERYGWGVSYAEQLFVRPIPRDLMPDKYDLLEEETVGAADVGATLGWRPPPGWAPTLFAHLYIEFAWLSVAASLLLGAAYGWAWRRSVESPTTASVCLYLFMASGLLHLVAQEVWAMAVPLLLMFVPCWAAIRLATVRRHGDRAPAAAPPHPAAAPAAR
jgi:hypothetical protein